MKHNVNSVFEKPASEAPRTCKECPFFKGSFTCTANGCKRDTFPISRPDDRPLPSPLNCPWWYMNSVWSKVSQEKINEYSEQRLHYLTAWRIIPNLTGLQLRRFSDHLHRAGGGGIIDFDLYPEAKAIYEEVKKLDS